MLTSNPQSIEILTRHAFNSPSSTTSHHALRCLANAMLLKPATRQMFVDLHYEQKLCNRLKLDSRDDEFLISRIIFLTTYGTNIDLETLIDKHHLAENIDQNLSRHAAYYDEKKTKKLQADPMTDMALTETLKLLFNMSHFCHQRAQAFTPAIPSILTILRKRQVIPNKPLEAPFGPLVNCLINLDLNTADATHALFPETDPKVNAERLVELLDLAIQSYKEDELDQQASPLLTLIRKVYEVAPAEAKTSMRTTLLPGDEDRKKPLGKTETLSSRLLRLSTSPMAPQLREAISSLLFEMSDKDARKFVQNIGYGFASGFLFQHNVPIPENALDAWNTGENGARSSSSSHDSNINSITGQAREFEPKNDGPEMTREEKEREAEKLFVLFERHVIVSVFLKPTLTIILD
jgi:Guanine nucleotide exchange factor synembryn